MADCPSAPAATMVAPVLTPDLPGVGAEFRTRDTRRDEEQDLVRVSLDTFSLEQISKDRNSRHARRAVLCFTFVVKQYAADYRCTAIGNGDLRLHDLTVDRRSDSARYDRRRSVFRDNIKNDRTDVGDLRGDLEFQRHINILRCCYRLLHRLRIRAGSS